MRKIFTFLSVTAILVLSSCGGKNNKVTTFPKPVETMTVKDMEYVNSSFTGVVKAVKVSNLAFKTGGQLIKLNVDEGQTVTKGEFIAEIDPIDYNLKLEAAKAAYIKSKAQLERFSRLIERDAISKQEFEGVQAAYTSDKVNYDNAKSMLNDTKIYAPFSGIIEKRFAENYQRVQPSEPVVTLIDPNDLEMRFILSESSFNIMSAKNKQFYVKFEAYPNHKFKAKLTKFVNSLVGGGFPVTVQIDDPEFSTSKFNIKPGFSCTIYIEVHNVKNRDLIAVPATSIYVDMDSNTDNVWIYNPTTSTVSLRKVTIETLYGTSEVIINSGLTPGEQIVVAGIYSLVQGEKVKVIK